MHRIIYLSTDVVKVQNGTMRYGIFIISDKALIRRFIISCRVCGSLLLLRYVRVLFARRRPGRLLFVRLCRFCRGPGQIGRTRSLHVLASSRKLNRAHNISPPVCGSFVHWSRFPTAIFRGWGPSLFFHRQSAWPGCLWC